VNDVRWFAANRYTALIVPELQRQGLSIALQGPAPARLAIALSGNTALEAWKYSRRHGCPLVLYLWDLPPVATGSGSPDRVWSIGRSLFRMPRLRGGFGRRRGYYSRLCHIAREATEVWAPSAMSVETLQVRFGVAARRVPYCYDSKQFIRRNESRDLPPTLLTVGRLKPHKNHQATLHAARRIGPGVAVRLIGRGPEAAALEQTAQALGVSCRIETGADDAAVVQAYQRASVAVCPSRFEGFGLAPLEAIACGTPVVASDIPPHREFAGAAASFFPLDDEDALTAAVLRALDAPPPDGAALVDLTIPATAARFRSALGPLL
jgi:glycosyltransferase involved in cell wall biosynthesis